MHTFLRAFACSLVLAVLVAGATAHVRAQYSTHKITVEIDDSTIGDIELIGDFLATAAEGQEVSRTLRRIIMGAVGEVIVAANKRIDSSDLLTLDDGSLVAVAEDDEIEISVTDSKLIKFGPVFECLKKKKEVGGCQPVAVVLPTGETLDIPPVLKKKK